MLVIYFQIVLGILLLVFQCILFAFNDPESIHLFRSTLLQLFHVLECLLYRFLVPGCPYDVLEVFEKSILVLRGRLWFHLRNGLDFSLW